MVAIRHLAATAILALVLGMVSGAPGLAADGVDHRLASLGTTESNASPWVKAAPAAAAEPAAGSGHGAIRPGPAVSLDRRVPAAQVTDREGLSIVGVLGVVNELRHVFSGQDRERPRDAGAARVVRTLRDSVFGKRISILSESGRISENEPFLVGLSFTH